MRLLDEGFTLVELLLYVALSITIILFSSSTLKSYLDYQSVVEKKDLLYENMFRSIRTIGSDTRSSSGYQIFDGGARVVIDSDSQVTYRLDSGRLQKQVDIDEPFYVTAADVAVTALRFTDEQGLLKVELSLDNGALAQEANFLPRND